MIFVENKNLENAFNYLLNEYKCSYSFENNYGDTYLFYNDDFKVKIYVWAQINELDINLIYKMENYHIDPYIEEPQKLLEIKKAKRGVKGFFNNYNKEFWSIVSIIVKNKIKRIVQ